MDVDDDGSDQGNDGNIPPQDKWKTIAIETVGKKYIANRLSESTNGVMYGVVPIAPNPNSGPGMLPYIEDESGRFRINVQMMGERSHGQNEQRRQSNQTTATRVRRGEATNRRKSSTQNRKAVGAKKPNTTLTAAGRRILQVRQERQQRQQRAQNNIPNAGTYISSNELN